MLWWHSRHQLSHTRRLSIPTWKKGLYIAPHGQTAAWVMAFDWPPGPGLSMVVILAPTLWNTVPHWWRIAIAIIWHIQTVLISINYLIRTCDHYLVNLVLKHPLTTNLNGWTPNVWTTETGGSFADLRLMPLPGVAESAESASKPFEGKHTHTHGWSSDPK